MTNMRTLSVKIETLEDTLAAAASSWKHAATDGEVADGQTLSFDTWDAMHRTLAPKRLEIIKAMAGQGPLSVRDVARRVGRDVKNVHADLDLLAKSGVIDRTPDGFVFPFDRIHVEFDIGAAA
ncbi:Predicted transcriptional regulator [Rhizobium sp. RU20A]|uniref:HVO_A0114 family putative DNA-binding protein n=1 Tax=Rhizobium sp. RU20A TaxID=1907412 RepID=UPI0009564BE5|nr:ArsR family transcriptional regulator [Rhizobium sp. RU20A]SIQ98363.1 Predicted transcriptional regulator [Rhizobium sp. RU20A]